MSAWTEHDGFKKVEGTAKTYELTRDLVWEVGREGSGWVMRVPKGTLFDISVPRWGEWFLSPHDKRVLPAAALHDQFLIEYFDPGFASSEFRRAAIARDYPDWRGWVIFWATLAWTTMHKADANSTRNRRDRLEEKRGDAECR